MTSALKLSVLYGHPVDPAAFEAYYLGTHLPLAATIPGLGRNEVSKALPVPDGAPPPYYRLFETWFESPEHLAAVSATPQWQQVTDDLAHFARGGVTLLLSQLG